MTSWLRRNRWGLALLLPALAAAVLASSFRYLNLYEPWIEGDVTDQSGAVTLAAQDDDPDAVAAGSTATLTPTAITTVASGTGLDGSTEVLAPEGSTLWRLDVDVAAPTQMVLAGCEISLLDDTGRSYAVMTGSYSGRAVNSSYNAGACTPYLLTGRTLDLDGSYIEAEPGSERPESWSLTLFVVMPDGVPPTRMSVGWAAAADRWVTDLPL